jgi:hypothetical protein
MASAIPAIAGAALNVGKDLYQGSKNVGSSILGGAADSAKQETTDTAATNIAPEVTGQQETQAVQQLAPATDTSNAAQTKAAEQYQNVVAPAIGGAVGQQQAATDTVQQAQGRAFDEYKNAVNETHAATTAAGDAIDQAAAKAKIDPQGYLHSLGTGQKVLTAIGMVLSGIGSGLTGQPNMAIQLYQQNTQNAIQAQQKNYENLMTQAAAKKGLLETAKDRQTISQNALFAATQSVLSGNQAAIEGIMSQGKASTANAAAQQLILQNQAALAANTQNHNQFYATKVNSGNKKDVNLLSTITIPVAEKINSDAANFKINQSSPAQRLQKTQQTVPTQQEGLKNILQDFKTPAAEPPKKSFLIKREEMK